MFAYIVTKYHKMLTCILVAEKMWCFHGCSRSSFNLLIINLNGKMFALCMCLDRKTCRQEAHFIFSLFCCRWWYWNYCNVPSITQNFLLLQNDKHSETLNSVKQMSNKNFTSDYSVLFKLSHHIIQIKPLLTKTNHI